MTIGRARRPRARVGALYHLADAANLDSILAHGLLSTERLLAQAGLPDRDRTAILRGHRMCNLHLPNGVVIRDQKPMPPAALAAALDDDMQPADWYALLNGHVFLWSDRDRMERQRHACGPRPQIVLTFDAARLLDTFGDHALVSPINSGNARRKPARRGRDTLVPYRTWRRVGWPAGSRHRAPAEFLFRCTLPAKPPYVVNVEPL